MPSVLVLDNVDSFTFTLVDYLRSLGAEVRVVRSDQLSVPEALGSGANGFLISPGPGRPERAGISVDLARACIDERRPLLGVCLGHQAIGIAAAATVAKAAPMHGKTVELSHNGSGLFNGLPSPFQVTRYHSLALSDVRPPLVPNAWSPEGVVQGVRHLSAPVHGVQFHPESIMSEHGHALLRSFVALCDNGSRHG
ncbi:anthranilate synthase component II [Sphingomonas arenae]|uniref:anthranilate synthase component II n=1 Tax=Sphingomonas arenae TaxID=2812555 RepID=UPI0019688482|nr:aminodeoxychorismate/anthranilate synthase component II [Sphingomonas arenae]